MSSFEQAVATEEEEEKQEEEGAIIEPRVRWFDVGRKNLIIEKALGKRFANPVLRKGLQY